MTTAVFESITTLPDGRLTTIENGLLGFEERCARVRNELDTLLRASELDAWNKAYHGGRLALCDIVADRCPFAIFHGDVGTGKTVMAECISNRLVRESSTEDSVLFKLSNRVRGSGKVGEMGTHLTEAFEEVVRTAGKGRRAILIIDEGDSLAAARSQEHSHHEDRVAVNTLIQAIDGLRSLGGRAFVILCTNRVASLDPAVERRAAIVEEFRRPSATERRNLFALDLDVLSLDDEQISALVDATGDRGNGPSWSYADIRTRLYPKALASAFPNRALRFDDLREVATAMRASPVMDQ